MINKITDATVPETLFKYRDWNDKNHRRLISHQEIYLPKPSEFNDPFDGNIPVRWDLLTYEQCLEKNFELIRIVNKDKDQRLVREYAKKVTDEKTLWHPEKLTSERPEQINKWDSIIGLFSLSSVSDNILRWSHYSSNHTGFAVGLDTESIRTDYDFDYLEPINYQKEYPLISGLDDTTVQFHKKFFHKSELWEYEKEWRVSKNHIEKRVIKLRKKTIKEIFLGCRFNSKEISKIVKLTEKHLGAEIPIYTAIKLEEEFGLRMERIK